MIKKFKRDMAHHYKIVKKVSSVLEAKLAEEVLNIYHIRTLIVKKYSDAHSKLSQTMREVYILVLPQDYRLAYRVLYR